MRIPRIPRLPAASLMAANRPYQQKALSPNQFNGLSLWLKADAGLFQDSAFTTAAKADGDPVGGWQDQSINANHVIQATGANRPTLKLGIQHGMPAVRFAGVNSFLQKAANILGTGNQPFTLFLVGKAASSVAVNQVPVEVGANPSSSNLTTFRYYAFGLSGQSGCVYLSNRGNDRATAAGTVASGKYYGLCYVHAAVALSANDPVFYVNDAAVASTVGTGTSTPNLGAGATTLGRDQESSPGEYFNGDLAEVIMYNRALSPPEIDSLFGYLNSRFGLY